MAYMGAVPLGSCTHHLPNSKVQSNVINRILAPVGLRVTRTHDWTDPTTYIPFAETIAKANASGLRLGDYIDARQGISVTTASTIEGMQKLGVFKKPIETLVEIGPGTGRYLEKTIQLCSPNRCEVYETAAEWGRYIQNNYPVILQQTDGESLKATSSDSVDLIQAHKVLCSVPFLTVARYWEEMLRVARSGGYVVFDVVTEGCLPPAIVKLWARSTTPSKSPYPATVPYKVVLDFFEANGAELVGTFHATLPPGSTEVFIFRKK